MAEIIRFNFVSSQAGRVGKMFKPKLCRWGVFLNHYSAQFTLEKSIVEG